MGDMSSDWRDKDDLDLTAEDVDAMLNAGAPLTVVGPHQLPGNGVLVTARATFGVPTLWPETPSLTGPARITHPALQ